MLEMNWPSQTWNPQANEFEHVHPADDGVVIVFRGREFPNGKRQMLVSIFNPDSTLQSEHLFDVTGDSFEEAAERVSAIAGELIGQDITL